MRVHPGSIKKMKNHLRELTVRGNKWSNTEREKRLKKYTTVDKLLPICGYEELDGDNGQMAPTTESERCTGNKWKEGAN